MTRTAPATVTPINRALTAVTDRFVRVPSTTAYPRFRDVTTGIEQADPAILLDWYFKKSTSTTPAKSATELLDSLKWVYGDGFLPNGLAVLPGNLQNLWKAPDIKPSGDRVLSSQVLPFLDFMARWFPVESERDYFLWWMAHTVRHPEKRIIATPVLRSEQGVGKGFFCETLMAGLLGSSSVALVTGIAPITGQFNECLEGKTFVLIDEVYTRGKSAIDALKSFQSNGQIQLSRKHKPVVTIPNFINYIMASNDHAPIAIQSGDRRFWLPQFIKHDVNSAETGHFINAVLKPWLLGGGLQLVRDYLETVDLDNFYPNAPAPMTRDKEMLSGLDDSDLLPELLLARLDGAKVITGHGAAILLDDTTTDTQAIAGALSAIGCEYKKSNLARFYITPDGLASGLSAKSTPTQLQNALLNRPYS